MRKKYIFTENTVEQSIMTLAAQYTNHWIGCETEPGIYCDEKPIEESDNRFFREVDGAFIPYNELPDDFYDNFENLKLYTKIMIEIPD